MKKQKFLSTLLAFVVFILSFIGNVPCAFANEYARSFEYNEDDKALYVKVVTDPDLFEAYSDLEILTIADSIITEEYNFEFLGSLFDLTFENCEFRITDLIFPEISHSSMPRTLFFDNCKFKAGDLSLPNFFTQITFNKKSYSNLGSMDSLESLCFTYCALKDLTGLSGLKRLTNLELNSCALGSLKGIEKLTSITSLTLHTNVESIKPIEALEKLDYLYLNVPFTRDISPIQNLENLTDIHIDCSSIASYEPLLNLKSDNIQVINVSASNMEAFSPEVIELLKQYDDYQLGDDVLEIKEKLFEIKNKIIKDGMSDLEIIKTVTEYVVNNLEYDYDVEDLETKEERDALRLKYNLRKLHYALNGKGVCANYSAFSTSLLTLCGINCYEIFNMGHVWQLIELSGEYYWLDTTYIDEEKEDQDITECPSYMSQDNEEFIKYRKALLIPSSMYNKLHNFPGDDLDSKDPKVAEVAQDQVKNEETALSQTNKKEIIIIVAVVVCVLVSVTIIILIIKKSKKKISEQNNVDYTDTL